MAVPAEIHTAALIAGGFCAPAEEAASGSDDKEAEQPERLDINSAEWEDFAELPGITPRLARRIVEFREKHGPFRRVEDLLAIRGIGHKKWRAIRERLTAGRAEEERGKGAGEGRHE